MTREILIQERIQTLTLDEVTFTSGSYLEWDNDITRVTLLDNIAIPLSGGTELVYMPTSKRDTESVPKWIGWSDNVSVLPDLFDESEIIAQTVRDTEFASITLDRNEIESATTSWVSSPYTHTLTATIGDVKATVLVHQEVLMPNKSKKRVDLNILAWYLLARLKASVLWYGPEVIIATQDKALKESAETFSV